MMKLRRSSLFSFLTAARRARYTRHSPAQTRRMVVGLAGIPAIALLLALPVPAHAASFGCTKAATPVEKLICADKELSNLDARLAVAYKQALNTAADQEAIRREEREWVKSRNACKDIGCLKSHYNTRLAHFADVQTRNTAKVTDRLTAPLDSIEPTAPGSHTYQLAMSKDDKLCRHMLMLFNDDLAKYGYEQYRQHKEFNNILWRDAKFSYENHGRIEHTPVKGALFDINNDRVNDFVIKWEASRGGILRDALYVLDSKAANRADTLVNRELFESKNRLDMSGTVYRLNPPFAESMEMFGILEPFIFESKSYIYMRPLFELFPMDGPRFSVLARYGGGRLDNSDHSGKMDDLCYFKRIRTDKR